MDRELRILKTITNGHVTNEVLQERIRNAHVDSSTTTPVPRIWSDWINVPIKIVYK